MSERRKFWFELMFWGSMIAMGFGCVTLLVLASAEKAQLNDMQDPNVPGILNAEQYRIPEGRLVVIRGTGIVFVPDPPASVCP
jgi:hypothetical protein